MLQEYSRYRILQEFFDYPRKEFYLRGLSRATKIAMPSVTNHMKALVNGGLIIKQKKGLYPTFIANRENDLFKLYKKFNLVQRVNETGLLKAIYDFFVPNAIILYGSASKGEDIEESDIDLFVQAKEKRIDMSKYEKLLKRKIHLFCGENFNKLSKELKNNILNGIILKGYIKVF